MVDARDLPTPYRIYFQKLVDRAHYVSRSSVSEVGWRWRGRPLGRSERRKLSSKTASTPHRSCSSLRHAASPRVEQRAGRRQQPPAQAARVTAVRCVDGSAVRVASLAASCRAWGKLARRCSKYGCCVRRSEAGDILVDLDPGILDRLLILERPQACIGIRGITY